MDPLTLIILAIIVYLLFGHSGISVGGQLFGGQSYSNLPAQGTRYGESPEVAQQLGIEVSTSKQALSAGLSAASSALKAVGAASSAIKAVPVVGAVIGGLIDVFAAQSQKRAQQATDENSAVAAAVPGWDQSISTIVRYYNAGQLTAQNVRDAIDAVWQNYWNETGPRIQPGRNGCQSGQVVQASTQTFCGGKTYGAACCVGYDDLKNSNNNLKAALSQTENTGKPANAYILPVFASKYGGINRPGYTLTLTKPTGLFRV